ncbi:MAG: SnoaL-like domain-containing protein [Rhodothermales bacterium]
MTHLELAQKLYQMIGEGKMNEALEELYDDNVKIVEANGDSFDGKETQKGRLVEWQNSLDGMHGGGVYAITANEEDGVTMVESWVDVTFKGAPGPMKFEEVAVQTWKNGKIVRERFYYNAAGM